MKRLYFRVIEDIRYVMSHLEVAQHVAQTRPELARAWLHLLAFVQGMYPQRRITSIHVEEENEDWGSAYFLEVQMATIHPLFVAGAATSCSSNTSLEHFLNSKSGGDANRSGAGFPGRKDSYSRPVRVGFTSKEHDLAAAGTSCADVEMCDVTFMVDATECFPSESDVQQDERGESAVVSIAGIPMPASLAWLISICTQVLDTWLALDAARELTKSGQLGVDAGQVSGQRRGTQWRGRGGRGLRDQSAGEPTAAGEGEGTSPGRGGTIREWLRRSRRFTVLEPRVWSEVVREQAAFGTNSASANQAAAMDVDMSQVGCWS